MEQSFADLLSGAFSETSAPSFSDGDLDFENLHFIEEDISAENLQTKEGNALHQEATSQTPFLLSMESADANLTENDDKDQSDEEDFQVEGVMSFDKTLAEDCKSSEGDSEQAGSVSEEDEEIEEDVDEQGDLMMLVCSSGNKEDRIFAKGQPLAPQGAENTQDRNKEQGDEEVSYFKRVPERDSEIGIKGDESEDDEREIENAMQEDTSDSECEGMKIKQAEEQVQLYKHNIENPARDDRHDNKKACLEFPEITVENQQDLLAEVESKECWEKVEDFSGEEHQEAGETFADYPSDLSSCEYVEENQEGYHQLDGSSSVANQDTFLERAPTDRTCMGRGEDAYEEGEEYLYSRNSEVEGGESSSLDVASGEKERGEFEVPMNMLGNEDSETGESDSSSSSVDEYKEKWTDEEHDIYTENVGLQENNNEHKETQIPSGNRTEFARWDTSNDRADLDINWNLDVLTQSALQSEDLLTTEDIDIKGDIVSDLTGPEDINNYLAVQRREVKNTSSSNQGSLDDAFFFTTDVEFSGVIELGQQVEDEHEEDRDWDQEQERIKAFFKFYDDSDKEEGREGRQSKVQFCTNPLSQVIHFETDSERESFSSSTDGEEDLSSGETSEELREPENDSMDMKSVCELPNTEITENVPDLRNSEKCARKHKRLNMMGLTLKMAVVILMGLVMLWLVTDQDEKFSPFSFF